MDFKRSFELLSDTYISNVSFRIPNKMCNIYIYIYIYICIYMCSSEWTLYIFRYKKNFI